MWAGDVVGSQRRVVAIFRTLNINLSRLIFHRGWFNETFPKAKIDQIALLHVDADFYDLVSSDPFDLGATCFSRRLYSD